METCRPSWSAAKPKLSYDNRHKSLQASIGKFNDHFYLQKNGEFRNIAQKATVLQKLVPHLLFPMF